MDFQWRLARLAVLLLLAYEQVGAHRTFSPLPRDFSFHAPSSARTTAGRPSASRPWHHPGWKTTWTSAYNYKSLSKSDSSFEANWLTCRHDPQELQNSNYDRWCQGRFPSSSSSKASRFMAHAVNKDRIPTSAKAVTEKGKVCAPVAFDRALALKMSYISSAVYNTNPASDKSWPAGMKVLHSSAVEPGSDYGLLARTADGNLVLAFRGTDDGNDWLSNSNIGSSPLVSGVDQKGPQIRPKVHGGFLAGFNKMRIKETCTSSYVVFSKCTYDHSHLYTALLNELQTSPPTTKVFITGHSRGGAIASIAALHLMYDLELNKFSPSAQNALNALRSGRNIYVYTYGEPRQLEFRGEPNTDTSKLDAINKFRFTYYGDPVPGIPPTGTMCFFDDYCETWRHWGLVHRLWQDDPKTPESASWGGDQYGLVGMLENRCMNGNFPDTYVDWSSDVWRHSIKDSYSQTFHRLIPIRSEDLPAGWYYEACLHTDNTCAPTTLKFGTCILLAKGGNPFTPMCMAWPETTAPPRVSVSLDTSNGTAGSDMVYASCTDDSCSTQVPGTQKYTGGAFKCMGPMKVTSGGVASDVYILARPTYTGSVYPEPWD